MKTVLSFLIFLFCVSAYAQSDNPAAMALTTGKSQMQFGQDPQSQAQKNYLTKLTGEDVYIGLFRVSRFKQQPKCGRILAIPTLAKSQKVIGQMAMQMNICEDGQPPLQTCDNKHLVLSTFKCPGGIEPHPTKEVQAAIDKAMAEGGMNIDQMAQFIKEKSGSAK